MATRRKARAGETRIAFDTLSIEGGLLSPEWISRVAQVAADAQSEADYRVPRGLALRDEIGRFWRIAQAHWTDFAAGRAAGTDPAALSRRFVTALLKDALGFESLEPVLPIIQGDRAWPIGHAALGGRVPIVVAPAAQGLDTLVPAFGDGGRRRSAFGLAQEALNAVEDALWGVATDGVTLRILRDNESLTRPAWVEADLDRVFTEQRYADFAALWLLAHETRFGRAGQPPADCPLEAWRTAGRAEGIRARDQLRQGVEHAVEALGQGFLAHPDNGALRGALHAGDLTPQAYFNELLRLVYRLIFLLTIEERGLLHPPGSDPAAQALYAQGYGLRRLRDRSIRRSAHDRHHDLWEGVRIVFRGLAAGEPRLALPALAGLFAPDQCPRLDAARLENRALMLAMFRLSWLREDGGLVRVNWRDMGPEELGSVYESLLELVPHVDEGGRNFRFDATGATKGAVRKQSGSYYTPDSLVQYLLDGALEPVVQKTIAANPAAPVEAILSLSVIDPACGSGHFLLSAARRLAAHVARMTAGGTPTASDYRHALRRVIGRCIFGVDRNPMAIELARMALWLEAMTPEAPLTFVDHHLVCGDALVGLIDLDILHRGVPSEAFEALEGDDREVVKRLAKRNRDALQRQERERQKGLRPMAFLDAGMARQLEELDALPDDSLEAIAAKRTALQVALSSIQDPAGHPLALAADLLVAAFVMPKTSATEHLVPTSAEILAVLTGLPPSEELVNAARAVVNDARGMHWRLAFAQVFARGGFDVVLGNPPWDTLSPDAKEFFSQWDVGVRTQSPEDQHATIQKLKADPAISIAWEEYCRTLYSSVSFMKNSGRYRLFAPGNLGKGDFNVYRMFVETALCILRPGGRASQIAPEGLYNGANCMKIREELLNRGQLCSLIGLENTAGVWFPGVHRSQKCAVYVAQVPGQTERIPVAFNIRTHQELASVAKGRTMVMPVELVREFSPDALALMEFGSQRDIDIAQKMYKAHPKFGDETKGPPHRHYMAEIHMGNDRDLFTEDPSGLPVYEGRMVSAYDHRAKGYRSGRGRKADWEDLSFSDPTKAIQSQWFIPSDKIPDKVKERCRHYRVGFCDVASPTNERTLVAALIPPGCVCGHKVPTITFDGGSGWYSLLWLGVANSFAMDYVSRKKVSLSMTFTVLDSLPFPRLERDDPLARYLVPRVARLVCTGPEMTPFWNQLATEGWVPPHANPATAPGETNEERRRDIEAGIDAFVAREIYGLTADELGYVLDTFPIVVKRDRKAYGSYRTKELILAAYDRGQRGNP